MKASCSDTSVWVNQKDGAWVASSSGNVRIEDQMAKTKAIVVDDENASRAFA